MNKKLFVGGLSWDTTDDSLAQHFSAIGAVISAKVIMDRFSGKSKGFGFVEMSVEDADRAIKELNESELDGRQITVNEARPEAPRSDRPRSDSFGGRNARQGGFRDNRNRY